MAFYDYVCEKCEVGFEVSKRILDSDKPELCPKCGGTSKRIFTATCCHGLSDGPGTSRPNKPHKPIFDQVDVHNDTQYAYNKMLDKGTLDKNPDMKKDMETYMTGLKTQPRKVVDYQKVGHPVER